MGLRLVFMGSPAFAVPALEALIASPHHIAGVFTRAPRPAGRGRRLTPSPAGAVAAAAGLPVFTPRSFREPGAVDQVRALMPDVIMVVAYGLLLPPPVLGAARRGAFNLHPSLLPRWRGAAPVERTIMAGDTGTAVAIIRMTPELDAGPIVRERRLPVPPDVTGGELRQLLARHGAGEILDFLATLERTPPVAREQAGEGIVYAPALRGEEAFLDWREDAVALERRIRALWPSPGGFLVLANERIRVGRARVVPGTTGPPGHFLDDNGLIACGRDALQLLELQRPGRRLLPAEAFLRGFPVTAGTAARLPPPGPAPGPPPVPGQT